MAIVKNLTHLMRGEVQVQSQEGMGSRFTIFLPLRKAAEVPNAENDDVPADTVIRGRRSATRDGKRRRVLLVEDYEGNVIVALTLLQDAGYEVVVANNGKEAIHKLENEPFDIVLMDVQMPVMDGITATRLIRKLHDKGDLRAVKIIGMTAHALAGDRGKCIDAGMDDYMSKPFDPQRLEDLLAQHLSDQDAVGIVKPAE